MAGLRQELDRLRRAWASARARDVAGRVHLVAIGVAASAALASRLFGPWPGLGALEGRWIPVALATAALLLLGPALRRLARLALVPSRTRAARHLDDALGLADAADTARGLAAATGERRPVEAFLLAQTEGRLREANARRLWPARWEGVWLRRLLLVLFVLVLLLPGVEGLLGLAGPGRGSPPGLGRQPSGRGTSTASDVDIVVWIDLLKDDGSAVPMPAPPGADRPEGGPR